MDGDGDLDIMGTSQGNNTVALWLNNGDDPIQWNKIIVDNDFYRVWPLYASDLDGDGDIDIIAGSSHQGNNQIRGYENLGDTTTNVEDHSNLLIPNENHLLQNYPNPFNPNTKISFQLSMQSPVSIKVYDIIGNEISTLVNKEKPAGKYDVEFDGSQLKSGVYFYQMIAGKIFQTKKMILIK